MRAVIIGVADKRAGLKDTQLAEILVSPFTVTHPVPQLTPL